MELVKIFIPVMIVVIVIMGFVALFVPESEIQVTLPEIASSSTDWHYFVDPETGLPGGVIFLPSTGEVLFFREFCGEEFCWWGTVRIPLEFEKAPGELMSVSLVVRQGEWVVLLEFENEDLVLGYGNLFDPR